MRYEENHVTFIITTFWLHKAQGWSGRCLAVFFAWAIFAQLLKLLLQCNVCRPIATNGIVHVLLSYLNNNSNNWCRTVGQLVIYIHALFLFEIVSRMGCRIKLLGIRINLPFLTPSEETGWLKPCSFILLRI